MFLNKSLFYTTLLSVCFFNQIAYAVEPRPVNCNQVLKGNSVYTVLNEKRNTLKGWNHIDVDNDEFKTLQLSNKSYQISSEQFVPDTECSNSKVQNAVLVAKLSDWTRQHANGFETVIDVDNITFSNISHVMIDLRINQDKTNIANVDLLYERYGKYLEKEKFNILDKGKANLGITLFEDGALDQSTASLNAQYFLEIDQQEYFDQWLRFLVPINEFDVYQEKEYTKIHDTIVNNPETLIHGFRLVAETSQGKQLRNLLGDNWNESLTETFKEVSISLRRIEFLQIN